MRSESFATTAPFVYFGGKRKVATEIIRRLGDCKQYIEPFCGSAAVLLNKPPSSLEVINDLNFYVANFWRAVKHQPKLVAKWADHPVVHIELHARHAWLTEPKRALSLSESLSDPNWQGDAKIAGWWAWGNACWIGSGWCETSVTKQIAHASDAGRGVTKKIAHASDAGRGVTKQIALTGNAGQGVTKQIVHASAAGQGAAIAKWISALSDRMQHVRVQNCDWTRVLNRHYGTRRYGTTGKAVAGILLDPPYKAYDSVYGTAPIAAAVEDWARDNAATNTRIALCGHIGDYKLKGWDVWPWSRDSTYGSAKTRNSEAIWFSPACLP